VRESSQMNEGHLVAVFGGWRCSICTYCKSGDKQLVNNGLCSKLPNIVKTLKIDYYIRLSQGQRDSTLISFFDFIPYLDIVLVILTFYLLLFLLCLFYLSILFLFALISTVAYFQQPFDYIF
jgi:hypothetical protein